MMGILKLNKEQWKDYFDMDRILHDAEESLHAPMITYNRLHIAPGSPGGCMIIIRTATTGGRINEGRTAVYSPRWRK